MRKKRRRSSFPAGAGAKTSEVSRSETDRGEAEAPAGTRRGRPGRRTADERSEAVLQLLSGKATVDQLASRYGVQPSTIEGWREVALEALGAAMRQGTAKSAREQELERDMETLREAFTDLAIRHELVERALKERPSRPGRSRR